jgi:hypothetical protein
VSKSPRKWYDAYNAAVNNASQALSEEQRKVLKALLIQQAVDLKASAEEQIDLLHHLAQTEEEKESGSVVY